MSDAIKLKVLPQFPSRLTGRAGIDVTKQSGEYFLDLDYNDFPVISAVPTGATYALIYNPATKQYAQLPIALLGGGLADAPNDGTLYGRKNLAWSAVPAGLADAPNDGSTYARRSAAWINVRNVLTADRNLFVNAATGSDANNGLTTGTAFATLQKAMDVIAATDNSIFNNVVTVANGTYAQLILKSYLGSGNVTFNGDNVTPGNVIITGSPALWAAAVNGGNFTFNGFRLQSSAGQDVNVGSYTLVTLNTCEWAGTSANYRIYVGNFGRLQIQGAHKVLTGGAGLLLAEISGFLYINGAAFTIGANVTYSSATATARTLGYISAFTTTFSLGAFVVTGQRYSAVTNSVISDTGSITLFPGTVAGSVLTGGQYT
ncbi:hypothetical protein IVB34_23340 [Bradyrhizobium sp. 2]|uniref:hypothetical protein n=1 Tax=unclassified Bradyrhizobium TaxID=2631580 RepID=UPI001FF84A03|nr:MULTISPECIES: hypothetical protein [unclassified Bradyrhizobium]MCK1446106.1 hypothetical protein [Bradyrhizobium sp. 48]MCK1461208.1 hypothetical protein [Bradyrhizobium sp. 2]